MTSKVRDVGSRRKCQSRTKVSKTPCIHHRSTAGNHMKIEMTNPHLLNGCLFVMSFYLLAEVIK